MISLVSAVVLLYRRFFREPRLDELFADARGLTRVVSGTVTWSVTWHELRGAELKPTFTGYDETEAGPEACELVLSGPRGQLQVGFELTPGEAAELRRVLPSRFGGDERTKVIQQRNSPAHPRRTAEVLSVVVHLQEAGTALIAKIGTLGVALALGFFVVRRYTDGVLHEIAYPVASFGVAMVFVAVGLKVNSTNSKHARIELTAVHPGSEPGWYRLPVKMSKTGAENFAHAVEARWPAFLETGAPPAPITRGAT